MAMKWHRKDGGYVCDHATIRKKGGGWHVVLALPELDERDRVLWVDTLRQAKRIAESRIEWALDRRALFEQLEKRL